MNQQSTKVRRFEVVIIGSGFGGLGMAINLRKIGIQDFVLLERESEMGGTWWRNNYPGAAVDVQSHLYSFSFESYNWSRLFALQAELLDYTNHIIDKYALRGNCHLNTCVSSLHYGEEQARWTIETKGGTSYSARFVINASGGLSQPSLPAIRGINDFGGKSFHTSHWDHDFDYRNKRVAVIGTGASGVQVIPAIAPEVKNLSVFQRTPHWVLPRPDRVLSSFERTLLNRMPLLAKAFRELTYWKLEFRIIAFQYFKGLLKLYENKSLRNLRRQVPDEQLRKKLIPDFRLGCKRVLLTSDYYPALMRNNVDLVTGGIDHINKSGIRTTDGRQTDVDLIVYATGFHASENNIPYPIIGRRGLSIQREWAEGAHAYLGTSVPGFPNFFILVGPNTGIGHTSALHIMESQINYICKSLLAIRKNNWSAVEVKPEVEAAYNEKIQRKLKTTVWQSGGCKSWYQTADGKNTILYPTFSFIFRKDSSRFRTSDHLIEN